MISTARAVAALGALVATVILAALWLGLIGWLTASSPDDLVPLLIAAALMCVVGLTRRNNPTACWLATIGAIAFVTTDLAWYANTVDELIGSDSWRWLTIGVCLSALLGTGAAAAYAATRPRLPAPWARLAAVGGVIAVAVAAVWTLASPEVEPGSRFDSLRAVTRMFLAVTFGLTAIGIIGDVLPVADRARRRLATMHQQPTSFGGRTRAWLRAFGDEIAPGRSRARRAVLDERSRMARDLHADVVPGLRQALAAAERDAPPDELAATLRDVLAEVEALGAAQHAIQLEIGGLVPALEWLTERVEERSNVTVTLNVADPPPGGDGHAPREIAAAAFRVAGLALDNVVRHAAGSRAEVSVRAGELVVDVAIRDDGPGIGPGALAASQRNGRRGLADMASEGAACGAVVEVAQGPGGVGTLVTFAWRSAAAAGR